MCLSSWIRARAVAVPVIQASGMVDIAFDALSLDYTFENGCDLICDLISLSAETPRSEALFALLYPRLINLYAFLQSQADDSDIARGVCRIYVELIEKYTLQFTQIL